ncbi:MAG TPA: efflux RND transporter permease subunit [Stellaceae bacterium]|jgi:multidrug efflux pump subunit AcrB|nr:efflux RND transporter permease subunit [Stellaceae bacterium]
MNYIGSLTRHGRAILFVVFALAIAGVYAGITLPVGLFPVTSFPRIRIEISTGSMPAKQMLIDVTEPLEEAARAVPGAVDVTSTTSRGTAQIFVDFPWQADMNQALLATDAAFAQKLPDLPTGTSYDILQMSPAAIFPFVSYALISDQVASADLRRLAEYQITPLLTGIEGIRRVGVLGGETPEIQVVVDPHQLAAVDLTLDDVAKALAETNVVTALGRLEDNDLLYLATGNNAFTSIASVQNVIVREPKGALVRLGDIAKVTMGSVPQWLLVNDNGRPAVTFDVFQQDSADSLALAEQVQEKLAGFMKSQQSSIHLVKWYDQTELVRSSMGALGEAIAIGLVFAALVILAFLRNWRATLVAILVVPLSVFITILLLSILGMSFNIMTLGGIAAAIGLLIDDVIVMVEHIARRAGVPSAQHASANVLEAAREFLQPLLGSSLATLIIFVPLAFLSGLTGAFFKFLSITMASALVISYVLAAYAVPLLAAGIIDFGKWHDPDAMHESWLCRTHRRTLDMLFARPLFIALGVAVLVGLGYLGYSQVGTGFLPRMDEGGFVLDYYSQPGTSLAETNRELEQVEAILKQDPDVETYSRRTGAGLGGDFKESYQGDFFIKLVDPSHRPPIWTIMDQISDRITAQVPGIRFDIHQLLDDMIGDMVGRPQPVVVQLSASNPDLLSGAASKVAGMLEKVTGIEAASVNNGVVPAGDALEINVDPAAAGLKGVTPNEVESQVADYLQGKIATKYLGALQDVGVRLWLDPPEEKIYRDQLEKLELRAPDGRVFTLGTVAKIDFLAGQPELTRDNLAQIVAVTAEISGDHDLGSTVAAVKSALDKPGALPPNVYYTVGGQYRQQQLAISGMVKVFAAAVVAEFTLLLFLYESFLLALVIILGSLISTGGVFLGLWITGVELNITAMMGMVMIVGIATEMAIFLASEYQALAATKPVSEALREAALNRLRPITMSTIAMILALAPLGAAISGSGDQMLQPLAIAIIAGIIVQLPLVLVAMPVVLGLVLKDAT